MVRDEYERVLHLTDEVGRVVEYEDLQRALVNAERDVGQVKYNLIPSATSALRATKKRKTRRHYEGPASRPFRPEVAPGAGVRGILTSVVH